MGGPEKNLAVLDLLDTDVPDVLFFFETTSVVENILEIVICHEHMVHHTGVGNSVLRFCRFGCVHLAKQQMTCPEYSNSMWYHERATAVLSICNRETHKNDQ